jgi:hypothetical protein
MLNEETGGGYQNIITNTLYAWHLSSYLHGERLNCFGEVKCIGCKIDYLP